jgi:RNA recognition motif-containing protein
LKRESGEYELRKEFGKFGNIEKIMIREHYCFINFEKHESAVAAIKEMDGATFVNGETLKV